MTGWRGWLLAAAAWAALLWWVCGCSVHTARFDGVFLYGRVTDCPKDRVPTQLKPMPRLAPGYVERIPDEHCWTTEVGAKSYADSISAIGVAVAAILAKIVLF